MSRLFAPAPEPKTELGRYRVLSRTGGIRVSPLCLGGMSWGDAWAGILGSMDKESTFRLLDAFFEAGGNFVDTANNYQNEQSETWLGEWMAERRNRDQMVVATKFTSDYGSYRLGKGSAPNFAGNHKKSLHLSCRDSLAKLQTEYIDIMYVHWWDHTTSVKELMDSLHALVEQGKVLYLGASDMPAWIVAQCNQYAVDSHKTPFAVYQGRWNVLARDFEREIIPMARMWGMALAPWDVLGGGLFQTKKAIEERRAKGEGLRLMFAPRGQDEARQSPDQEAVSAALEKVAGEVGVGSITAVALAYVMTKAENVFPIVGGRKVEHLQDNIEALSIKLSEEQVKYLESVKEFDLGFPTAFLGTDPNVTGYNYRLDGTAKMAWPHLRK